MAVDEQDVPVSIDNPAVKAGRAARQGNKQERLESLLLDDSDPTQSVDLLAAQEVRVVSAGKGRQFGALLGLLLLCVLLLGTGYYYLSPPPVLKSSAKQLLLYVSPRLPVPVRPNPNPSTGVTAAQEIPVPEPVVTKAPAVSPLVNNAIPLFTVTVGPFVNTVELEQATNQLQELGLKPQKKTGRGLVTMIRLLEGIYPAEEARMHLAALKQDVKSAFLLPNGDGLAVYAGSFHQEDRARQMQGDLAQKKVNVTLVDSRISMNGTMLVALQADQQTAGEVAAHISSFGLQTQVIKKK
ncbi:MAG: hypothetical protein QM483_14330 [Desulfuromusa sp.]